MYEFLNLLELKILIAGYGKMGHELELIALERGHTIVAIFNNELDWLQKPVPQCDVAIDFSTSETAPFIVNRCFDLNIPVVSGTTGWNEKRIEAKNRAVNEGKSLFYASNFSLGVNIFFEINKKLASFLCPLSEYGVSIREIHHIHKKDAPSGTAITLAEGIIDECDRYESWVLEKDESTKVRISSERIGEVPGTHEINWNSDIDSIQIKHTAYSRKGFALGAVIAAEWIIGRTGVFGMSDLLRQSD